MSSNRPREGRIAAAFSRATEEDRAALVLYLTAGFPDPSISANALERIAEAGADVIELGIPFSDPMADGPTIQDSSFRALEAGMTTAGTLEMLRDFRSRWETPIVLFTYLNPVFRYGVERFLADAAEAGADGLLLTDLPVGADDALEGAVRASPLDLVRLVAPTTPEERVPEVARGGEGFLYYVSRTGVTGARNALRDELAAEVSALRERVELPIAVGFGISDAEQASAVSAVADGVVVGSALIQALDRGGAEGAERFTREIVPALRR